jgi:tetratricopeptide (TPR) repeat protein
MICPKCGSEIADGKVYCSKCGKEMQLVPEYRIEEEEILQDKVPEQIKQIRKQERSLDSSEEIKKEKNKIKKKKSHGWIIWMILLFAAVGAGIYFFVNYSFFHSYSYQMNLAINAYNAQDYEEALDRGERALTLKENDLDAILLIAQSYEGRTEYDKEEEILLRALKLYPKEEKLYKALISTYTLADQYDNLYDLAENAPTDELKELVEEYLVESPTVSVESGSYNEPLSIVLKTEDTSLTIYYTLDGTTPDENSQEYTEPITIEVGEASLMAVAYDENGHYSVPTEEQYNVNENVVSSADISLASGTYYYDNEIVITADAGCKIYYAWDTTEPSEITTEYTGSLYLLEGNHVLAVLVEDSNGKTSSVITRSYIYLPEE